MYDIKWIRENPEAFDRGLKRRNWPRLAERVLAEDEKRRLAITELELALARRNAASKEIGEAKKAKDEARAAALMAEVAGLKTLIPNLELKAKTLDDALNGPKGFLATVPNLPLDEVPDGADEHGNIEKHKSGEKRSYSFTPKQHFELGEALGMMDFELAAKLSGARFVVLQKGLARLERALGQFFLNVHTAEAKKNSDGVEVGGYVEVNPPLMVKDEVMYGTAQLPKFAVDQYDLDMAPFEELMERVKSKAPEKLAAVQAEHNRLFGRDMTTEEALTSFIDGLKTGMPEYRAIYEAQTGQPSQMWLIPTAEVPLTNLVRESIVDENTLPRRYTACTPCFRAEAGAAGRDTRGMIRQHQFTKVELVSITTPEESKAEHERMLACAEEVLKKLDLHYRVITLCNGDMGFASQKTYDIEVWLPGQNMYREISSCSVCGDFQARRMNARYRGKDNKPAFVHTLNGSGVAVGRALIAVMETYQQEDGSIAVPDVLKPYMGGIERIAK